MKHRRHVVAAAAGIVSFVLGLQWAVLVGRVPLLLLDTDVAQNDSADRPITSILYTPGREMRLAQELVLGIGGLLRRIGEQHALAGSVQGPHLLYQTASHVAFVGWVLIAVSTVWRLTVMWPYLHRDPNRT